MHPGNRSALGVAVAVVCALALALAIAIGVPGTRGPERTQGLGGDLSAPEATGTPSATPRLLFEAPPRYQSAAERLERTAPARLGTLMDLVGLRSAGAPIQVVLAAETHPLARGVPAGIAGYAVASRDLAVLLPERVPHYPYDSLDVLFLHEVMHLLAARAAGDGGLPRWFDEGLALLASRGWSLGDRSRVVLGAVSGAPGSTAELEAAFYGGAPEVATAYALSGALVHHLVRRHGPGLVPATLERVAAGEAFDDAFASVAGVSLWEAQAGFWSRYRLWYRWMPFLTSGAALWAAVTALAVLAGVRRRQRDAAIRRRWEEEEQAAAAAVAIPVARFDDAAFKDTARFDDVTHDPRETVH
ncbi:MAG TPA: hypothetical protein VMS86_06245 [Thermoanaerobaculia bacterium]|nr:hypothetical protein [Thermoanaerobaculia bacterium]